MKVTVEFNTDDPKDYQKLMSLFGSPAITAADAVAKPATAPTPATDPAPATTEQKSADEPKSSEAPTSFDSLQVQLQKSFGLAYAKDPAEASKIAENARAQFGPEANNWTDQQLSETITRIQAIATL